jgi:hypothetical protein
VLKGFTVRIVSAPHRPEVYAEIELDGDLVAEAFADAGQMRLAFVGDGGQILWEASADELRDALDRARGALADMAFFD